MIDFAFEFVLSRGMTWSQIHFSHPCRLLHESIDGDIKTTRYAVRDDSGIIFDIPYKSIEETVTDNQGKIIRDQIVKISQIWADDIKLDMQIMISMFEYRPQYRQDFIDYCRDNNISLDPQPLQALEFWHAGQCKIDWQGSFWYDYARRRRIRQRPDEVLIEQQNYVGYDTNSFHALLAPLKHKLDQCGE